MRFISPDAGGGSGGGDSSGAAKDGAVEEKDNPFSGLPWDELDDSSRASLKTTEQKFLATLQQTKKLEKDLEVERRNAAKYQSESDRLKAEKAEREKPNNTQPDPFLQAAEEELRAAGYNDDGIKSLAPVFAGMFKKTSDITKKQIGTDLGPMANTVLAGQAQAAFQQAQASDPVGMFQTPEVAQKVWDFVLERTKAGEATTPEIVLNLGKMVWVDHVTEQRAAGKTVEFPSVLPKTPPANMNTGFTFPGGGAAISPTVNQPVDRNSARTVLDPDTKAALATSLRSMVAGLDIKLPADFQVQPKTGRRH